MKNYFLKTVFAFLIICGTFELKAQCNVNASFTYKDSGGIIEFYNSSTNANRYIWELTSKGITYAKDPIVFRTVSGFFYAKLIAIDSSSNPVCSDTMELIFNSIGVCNVNADFDFTNNPANPLEVSFKQMSSSNNMKESWFYGDGTSSSIYNATHTYPSAGTYIVKVVVEDSINNCMDSISKSVTVKNCYVQAYGLARDTFGTWQFYNFSTYASTYLWDFGDTTAKSRNFNPSHVYTYPGNHTITLIARDTIFGNCSDTFYLTVPGNICRTKALFSFTQTGNNVQFINNSYWGDSYFWDFGNGDTSRIANPQYTYMSSGTFNVKLFAYDSKLNNCYNLLIKPVVIAPCKVTANFSFNQSHKSFSFTNTSSNANRYMWIFGDGDTSYLANPTHTYANIGNYTIRLKAMDSTYNNCKNEIIKNVYIQNCFAYFEIIADTTQQYSGLLIDKSVADSNTDYRWYFGDGDSSISRTPTHTYNGTGPYIIHLYLSGNACYSVYKDTIGFDSSGNMNQLMRPFSLKVVREGENNTSISSSMIEQLKFWPNPVHNELNIDFSAFGAYDISIFDLKGVAILNQSVQESSIKLDVSELNSGVYCIRVSAQDGSVKVVKFIKD